MRNIISVAGRIFSSSSNITIVNQNGRVTVNGDLVENPADEDGIVEIRVLEGSVHSVKSDRNVVCADVTESVKAGGNVVAKSIGGDVKSGGNTTSGPIGGSVKAQGNVNSGTITGDAKAGGNINVKG